MTRAGETTGFTVSDHVRAIEEHVGPIVTEVLVHSGEFPEALLARHKAEDATPVILDLEALKEMGIRVREADLLSDDFDSGVRYDPDKLAREVWETALARL